MRSCTCTIFLRNRAATTETYTLSLHDALPISFRAACRRGQSYPSILVLGRGTWDVRRQSPRTRMRSEEHTSELQSHSDLVCRLLLEKKNSEARRALERQTTSPIDKKQR